MIKNYDCEQFFSKYSNTYRKIFGMTLDETTYVKNYKSLAASSFYCKYNGSKLLAFFSVTKVSDSILELGDVSRVSHAFRRQEFAAFLNEVSEKLYIDGCSIVGFPNKLALKLELQAGYQITKYYLKQPTIVIFNLEIHLPIVLTQKGYKFDLFKLSASKSPVFYKKTRRRFILARKSSSNARISLFGLTIRYIEHEKSSYLSSDCGFPYISYNGSIVRLLAFEESDNSA